MKALMVPTQSGRLMGGRKKPTHAFALGAAIVERRDQEIGSNTTTTVSKKSRAVHLHRRIDLPLMRSSFPGRFPSATKQ